jgi:hemerythrin
MLVIQLLDRSGPTGKPVQLPATAVRKQAEDDAEMDDSEGSECDGGNCKDSKKKCDDGSCGMSCDQNCSNPPNATGYNGDTSAALDEGKVAAALDLVSVKVPSMDAEHADCAAALKELVTQRSKSALEAVQKELSEHFAHEEELFVQYGWGGATDQRFSARKSHIEDHQRILRLIQQELRSTSVSTAFIQTLLTDFHEHTSKYDVQYADLLSSKGAQ